MPRHASLSLSYRRVEFGVSIEVDRQVLSGAVANLLQNAFKFTKTGGRVSLKSFSSADRVLIEVEDECGGLPLGESDELFQSLRAARR